MSEKNMRLASSMLLLAALQCSCAIPWFSDKKVNEEVSETQGSTKNGKPSPKNLELRVAKLYAKLDEMELELRQQRERQILFEKTLLLGVIPEYLKGKSKSRDVNPLGTDGIETGSGESTATPVKKELIPKPQENLSEDDRRIYESELAKAQAQFNAGKYGEAIVLYEAIGKKYAAAVTNNNQKFWVGVSWFYLKDYVNAKRHLEAFKADSGQSPLHARSNLYLALCDRDQGLVRQAQSRLKALLEEFPDSDVAESAQFELKKLEERL